MSVNAFTLKSKEKKYPTVFLSQHEASAPKRKIISSGKHTAAHPKFGNITTGRAS